VSPPLAPDDPQDRFLESVTAEFLVDHVAVTAHEEADDPWLQIRVTTPVDTSDFRLVVYLRTSDSTGYRHKLMPRLPGTLDLHAVSLPAQEPGSQYRYHLTLQNDRGEELARLPQEQDKDIRLRFYGQVPVWLTSIHVASLFLAAMFACLALIDTARPRPEDLKLRKLSQKVLTVTCLLLIAGFVTSAAMSQARRGLWWGGWPCGDDLTQTSWSIVILYWIFLTLVFKGTILRSRPQDNLVPTGGAVALTLLGVVMVVIAFIVGANLQ
jgi:hypothetical protein